MIMGAALAAAALDTFLIPNKIIDGGVVGISIMASYLTNIPLGVFVTLLNIPFIALGYKHIGKSFVAATCVSVLALSVFSEVFHGMPLVTKDPVLAAIFGGMILGTGVGLIIRNGGSLDGTEMVAIILNKRTGFSVGEVVMFFNIFILGMAGFVFGWNNAMYSILAYFVAFKAIDVTIEGLDSSKSAMIVSEHSEEIATRLMAEFGRGVTFLLGKGGYSREAKRLVYIVITRLEISKLKNIVNEVDPNAFVTISDVHDVMARNFKKKTHKN
jgi:uncharacterized membrane-anchored protein YitT (DUF2179 family)